MTNIYTIYGCGGYGREVMPLLRDHLKKLKQYSSDDEFYFIDDNAKDKQEVNGYKVLSFQNLIKKFSKNNIHCCVAISDQEIRKKLTDKCVETGISIISVFSNQSIVMDEVVIGDGSILSHFTTITSNVLIGKSFHANIYSYVGHDCIIGDFVTFAPGVKCNGNVKIENGVYVGTGAIIYPGTTTKPIVIGKNSKIAAGAIVTKNVPDNFTAIGSPAKFININNMKK